MTLLNQVLSLTAKRYIKTASELFIYHSNYTDAADIVLKALEIEPKNTKARVLYADILFCLNRELEALAILDELIAEQTGVAEAYISRAGILDALGKQRQALTDCSMALKYAQTSKLYLYPSIYEQKMVLLLNLKLHKACKRLLNDAAFALETEDFDCLLNTYHRQLSHRRFKQKEQVDLNLVPSSAEAPVLKLIKA